MYLHKDINTHIRDLDLIFEYSNSFRVVEHQLILLVFALRRLSCDLALQHKR